MSRPFPRICATCRERKVEFVILPSYSTNVDHDGRSYAITLANVSGTQCQNCGVLILDDSVSDRIDDQLRDLAGLLRPVEIRSRRKALNLTQKALAQKLRISEATLSRWETGAQIQQRSMDVLLRLYFELPIVRQHLEVALLERMPNAESSQSIERIAWLPFKIEKVRLNPGGVSWPAQAHDHTIGSHYEQLAGYKTTQKPISPKLRLAV